MGKRSSNTAVKSFFMSAPPQNKGGLSCRVFCLSSGSSVPKSCFESVEVLKSEVMEIHVFVALLGKVEHISLTNEMKKWCLGIWALSRSDPWEARWQFSPTLHSDLIQWKL